MSGEETLAQVYRELEHPKITNLKKVGFIIFAYSLIFTAGVSFFAVMIIPDATRPQYFGNLIGGLAMNFAGPYKLRLVFQAFVVLVGVLMLAGAVNTAIVGSNGVLNRVSEDGILPQWFRQPHGRFGTSYRMINLVVGLQIATIILSRGNIFLLGEAYAFGVMWSFFMNSAAVLTLRYQHPGKREFRVPLNLKIGNVEIPLGLVPDHAHAACSVHHQSFHQADRHHLGHCLYRRVLRHLHHRRKDHQEDGAARERSWINSMLLHATKSPPLRSARGPATCWFPSAISMRSTIWEPCWTG